MKVGGVGSCGALSLGRSVRALLQLGPGPGPVCGLDMRRARRGSASSENKNSTFQSSLDYSHFLPAEALPTKRNQQEKHGCQQISTTGLKLGICLTAGLTAQLLHRDQPKLLLCLRSFCGPPGAAPSQGPNPNPSSNV